MADFPVLTDGELASLVELDMMSGEECSALMGDIDLKEYARQSDAKLAHAEDRVLRATVEGSGEIESLHMSLDACDDVLRDIESSLGSFFTDIEQVTDAIQSMQGEMGAIQRKLENRRAVEKHLSAILSNALVPPAVVNELANSDVTDSFIGHIDKVSRSCAEVNRHPHSAIAAEVKPCLQSLTLLLTSKVRSFLLAKIALLNRPKTNITIIQQSVLSKYRPLMRFLLENYPEAAQDVKDSYVATLSHIYYTKTKGFVEKLTKLEKKFLTKSDLISTTKKTDPPNDPALHFSFRARTALLEHWNAPIVVPYIDKEKGRLHAYENLYRSMHLMLLDIITSEYIFTYTFFHDCNLYIPIFQKVITLCRDSVAAALPNIHDHLTLATCVQLTLQFKGIMAKRAIPCLDGYMEGVLMKLWGQLDAVLRANITALHQIHAHPVRISSPAVLPMAAKFAEFTGLLYSLFGQEALGTAGDTGATEHNDRVQVLHAQLHTLAVEMHRILHLKSDCSETDRHLLVVLNLQHVLDVWGRYKINPDSHQVTQMVTSWVLKAKGLLVDGLIDTVFPNLVGAISTAEASLRQAAATVEPTTADSQPQSGAGGLIRPSTSLHDQYRATIDEKTVLATAEQFGRTWQARIKQACQEVLRPGAPTGAELVTRLVMQVAIYNERLKKVLTTCWLNPPCRNWLVANQALLDLMQEILGKAR